MHCLKKGQHCETGRQKLSSQLSILVDESDAVNPSISHSDEEDTNEEMNEFENEKEIIMKICSFLWLLCQRKKLNKKYFEFVNKRPAHIHGNQKLI